MKKTFVYRRNLLCLLIVCGFVFFCCSSSPEATREITQFRESSSEHLQMGSRTLLRGDLEQAAIYMEEAIRQGKAADDYVSVVRALIGRGSVFFSAGELSKARDSWVQAKDLSQEESFSLGISAAELFYTRSMLAEGNSTSNAKDGILPAKDLIKKIEKLTDEVSIDFSFYTAGLQIKGLAYKELGNKNPEYINQAIATLQEVATMHENRNYFEDAAYDWYMIASVYSLNGKHEKALDALQTALQNDRKAENSWGLAADWLAIAKINAKAQNLQNAKRAANRSLEIATAAFLDASIAEAQAFLKTLK